MTPVRQAQKLVHSAVHTTLSTAWYTARHPVSGASRVVGLARGAVGVAKAAPGIVADTVATRTQGGPPADAPTEAASSEPSSGEAPTGETARDVAKPGPLKTTVPDPSNPTAPPAAAQGGVPDLAPPDPADRVLVVEEALAAEAADEAGAQEPRSGVATEPHASTRAEDHGERPLARAEIDELAEEAESRE